MAPAEPPPDDDGNRSRANIAVLVAVIVLLVIGWFVMQKFEANQRMETCLIERHSDCNAILIPPR